MEYKEMKDTDLERLFAKQQPEIDKTLKIWESAVLLPLRQGPKGWEILFEVRSAAIKWQPGDICFPGGHKEEGDADFVATALRETEEELGIPRDKIQVLGPLPYFYGYSGPMIFPYAGIIPADVPITTDPEEVAEVFTVPLRDLLAMEPMTSTIDLGSRRSDDFPYHMVKGYNFKPGWNKRTTYTVYFYPWQDRVIWGITARVLHHFLEKIRAKSEK